MATPSCRLEPEILDAVLTGRLTDDLRAHAAECTTCGEVAKIAGLVRDDFNQAQRQAQVPTAGAVWLRAQIRAREEAARTAARPIVLTQALTIAALIGLLVAVAGRISLTSFAWPTLEEIPLQVLVVLGVALVSWLVVTPIVLYLAFSRD
jgi:hypothetical protein